MSHAKKTSTEDVAETAVVPKTASEAKRAKLESHNEHLRKYLLTPADYRVRVVDNLAKQVHRLLLLARTLGSSASGQSENAGGDSDKYAETITKKLGALEAAHVQRLRKLNTYYTTLYRVAGKRAEKIAKGIPSKQRVSTMHRSIAMFHPSLYNFIREAAAQNEALRPAARCATFDESSPLHGYMSPSYAAQFILAYVASNRRFNKDNGQYIQPDALMETHLRDGIAHVLSRISTDKRPQEVEKAKKFPGQFTFCKLQELIGFYRVKHEEGSVEEKTLDALRKNQDLWPVLLSDFDTMSKLRENAYARLHSEQPKPVKPAGPRGPRGQLTEAQKNARRIKREAKAAANALGYDLALVPKAEVSA